MASVNGLLIEAILLRTTVSTRPPHAVVLYFHAALC